MGDSLLVMSPCYGGNCSVMYAKSLVALTARCIKENISLGYETMSNASLIPDARNKLTRNFMATDFTHMLFIDSDIEFDPEHVVAMFRSGKRIVGGTYPQKAILWDRVEEAVKKGIPTDQLKYYATRLTFNPFKEAKAINGFVPVQDISTGLLMIQRDVITKMYQAYPETLTIPEQEGHRPTFGIFDCFNDGTRALSEDFAFCRRAQKIGETVYCYMPAVCKHAGTYVFEGTLATSVEQY